MKADELLRAYDEAKERGGNLDAFPSVKGLSRDQVETALRKYDRMVAGQK